MVKNQPLSVPAPKKPINNSQDWPRIGIDCRLAGIDHSGIGRYISQLVENLLESKPPVQLVLFCRHQNQADSLIKKANRAHCEVVISPVSHYSWLEQLMMPFYFWRARLDLLHVPHFNVPLLNPVPLVVTIHDLLWHQHRGTDVTTLSPLNYLVKYWFYKLVVSHAINSAQKILVPSLTIKNTVKQFYPTSQNKIEVTYEGITPLPPAQAPDQIASIPFLLYVGNLYPHKNVEVILKALVRLSDLNLVICGSRDAFCQKTITQAYQLGLKNRVHHLGKVTDSQLSWLYQHAYALVLSSKSEGFGLTGLEAMSQGCPVVASNIPIFAEIYQSAVLFFHPDQAESLVTALNKLQTTAVRQAQLKRQNNLIKNYDWQTMAQKTLAVYQSVIKNIKPKP